MKAPKKLIVCLFLLLFLFPVAGSNAEVTETVKIGQEEVSRSDVVWAAGYWAPPNHWNPAWWGGEAWGGFFMYLPMFDYNYEQDALIPMLGETMAWSTDGSELTITMHEEATWSDGEPITSQDVNWTFNWYYDSGQFSGAFSERVEEFEIVNDYEFVLHMNTTAGYQFSKDIWQRFVGYYKVLPEHVWQAVVDDPDYGNGNIWNTAPWANFQNNWLREDFPEEWKVGSGPYEPYFVSETKDKQIYKKVENWWGADILADNYDTAPSYIGQLHYATNFAMNSAYADNQIDWYGGYYPRIWELMEENENIHCWVDEDPYFLPISGMIELVPNHLRYPFNQHWLAEAFAYAINYQDLSEVSASGYLEKARVGFVDDRSPIQDDYFDPTVEEEYAYDFNPVKAKEVLAEHCFQVGGVWYTKNSDDWLGKPGPGGSNITDQLDTMEDDEGTDVDEAALSANVNVKLGDWDIIVPYGWSDSMMQTTLLSNYFMDIGITTNPSYIEYNTYVDQAVANGNMNFDLMHFVMGFAPANDIYNGLSKFTGAAGTWTNFTGWHNPEFVSKLEELEVAEPGTEAEKQIVFDMQEILASNLPSVPIAPNGYWYGYNNKYWENWPNEKKPYVQAAAPWETGHNGVMLEVLMSLRPAGTGPGAPFNFTAFSLGLLVLGAFAINKRKRK